MYTYISLSRINVIELLDKHLPMINRKALAVSVMGCIVLCIQTMSLNVIRGQEVVRLRASLRTSTEKILMMSLAVVILLFAGILCIVYFNGIKPAITKALLKTVADYDDDPASRSFIDRIQIAYNCCGINSSADYQDLSSVNLHGIKNTLPRDKTLNGCPHEDLACLYPLSCCFSVECTEYRLAELNVEGDRFHERWYKNRGCVHALFSAHFGLLEPVYSVALIFFSLGMQMLGLLFAQLTLTGYLTLSESGLSDADESVAWLLPFSYPGPEDIVQHLTEWAAQIYINKDEITQKEAKSDNPEPRAAGTGGRSRRRGY
ncbi:unnamed protein product [Cylicocyclus nassatus]|uniref:Tetraspanin n=1 Tax=Cylicocyclus nassatus TaxID=53992 RepID=A0AA36GP59_CYLNA|nr:unnamed protein product [Cylicocyclus nassatus]